MAKKGPPEDDAAKRVQVTLDPLIAKQARIVAAAEGVSVPDYVNSRLAEILTRELPAAMAELGFVPGSHRPGK